MIKTLTICNFRNYGNISLNFDSPVNILTGANGQGKTSLLEAIYFISYLRSFRCSNIRNLKKINSNGFYLSAEVSNANKWTTKLEVEYLAKRALRIDNAPVIKSSEFISFLKPIIFTHEDIKLITEGPRDRRKFIDIFISSINSQYFYALREYMGALKARNAILRSIHIDLNILIPFEKVMAKSAETIIKIRRETLELLSSRVSALAHEIKDNSFNIKIQYNSKLNQPTLSYDFILDSIAKNRKIDLKRRYSSTGPHTDEFDFILNERNLKHFGSLGQCRFAALCLKMAAIELTISLTGSNHGIIALIDDITGDLDSATKKAFFNVVVRSEQAFLTSTAPERDNNLPKAQTLKVIEGRILPH